MTSTLPSGLRFEVHFCTARSLSRSKILTKIIQSLQGSLLGVMNGPLKFLTARKILPLLDLLAKFKRLLACSCSQIFALLASSHNKFFNSARARQKNRSARHSRECSQRPFVTPFTSLICHFSGKSCTGTAGGRGSKCDHKSSSAYLTIIPRA